MVREIRTNPNDNLEKIISHFKAVFPEGKEYYNQLQTMLNQLTLIKTRKELDNTIDEINEKEKGLLACLGSEVRNLNQEDILDLENRIKKTNLSFFYDLMHYDELINKQIVIKQEKISWRELNQMLNKKQANEFDNFIAGVKNLKEMADYIRLQKEFFKQRLSVVKSLEEINDIEEEIAKLNNGYLRFLEAKINYPKDRTVAKALVRYFDENRQVFAIMQSFDFEESLIEDILNAKASLSI